MNLSVKFNLILIITFSICFTFGGLYSYQLTKDHALQQVTDQAELFMQLALAARNYTANETGPILTQSNQELFHPKIVKAFSSAQTANLINQFQSKYVYREAFFSPTNPQNKATEIEEKIINTFIANPGLKKHAGNFTADKNKSLYISYPIKITHQGCLECHGDPEQAPGTMQTMYRDSGGFDWKLNEIVGTQMVIVPFKLLAQLAQKTFLSFMAVLTLIFLILFIVLNIMIRGLLLKPITILTRMADDLSKGNITGEELIFSGKDEISELSRSLNRMRRSVIKIIQILRKPQHQAKK